MRDRFVQQKNNMIKKICITIIIIFQYLTSSGQLQENWSRTFLANEDNFYSNYPKLKIDNDQNLIVVGGSYIIKYDTLGNELWWDEFEGKAFFADPGDGNDHFFIDDENNIYVLSNKVAYTNNYDTTITVVNTRKYSPTGEEIWMSEYRYDENYSQDLGSSIVVDDEEVFITGSSIDTINYCDVFLICYDRGTGTEKWRTTYHDRRADCDRGNRIKINVSGDIIIGGKSTASRNNEYLLLKYDRTGSLQWIRRYEDLGFIVNLLSDIILTSDNNIVMTGHFYMTVGFSNEGHKLWDYAPESNLPPTTGSDRAKDIIAMENGDVLITGYHTDYIDNKVDTDILTMRINKNGSVIWSARHDLENVFKYDHGNAISVDQNDDVFIGGQTNLFQGDDYNRNFIILKYDGNTGELLWEFIDYQNIIGDDVVYSIYVSPSNAIYVTGVNYEDGKFQYVTKKYEEQIVAVEGLKKQNLDYVLLPNPSKSSFEINSKSGFGKKLNIEVFDLLGKSIMQINNYKLGEEINLNGITNGVYFVRIYYKNNIIKTMKLIIKR